MLRIEATVASASGRFLPVRVELFGESGHGSSGCRIFSFKDR